MPGNLADTLLFCAASLAITLGLLAYELRRPALPLPLPFATLVSAHYTMFYGFFPALDPFVVAQQETPRWLASSTMLFILAAQMAIAGGVLLAAEFWRKARPETDIVAPDRATRCLAWGCLGMHFAFVFLPSFRLMPSLNQLEQPLWLFGCAVLVWGLLGRGFGRTEAILAVAVILLKLGQQISTGFLTQLVLSLCLGLGLAVAFRRLRVAILALALAALAVLSYVPVKAFYNHLHNDRLFTAADHGVSAETSFGLPRSVEYATRRSAHGLLLQHVINRTPSEIPFRAGETLRPLTWSHVPRLVWPDKPREELGNHFGRLYGILNERDLSTAWNVPWLVEFYMNFGRAGALACMAAAGLAIGGLGRLLDRGPRTAFTAAVAAGTYFPLFHQESNVSVMAGNVLWFCALFLAGRWTLRRLLAERRVAA